MILFRADGTKDWALPRIPPGIGAEKSPLFDSENRAGSERLLQYNWIHRVRSSQAPGETLDTEADDGICLRSKTLWNFYKPAAGAC